MLREGAELKRELRKGMGMDWLRESAAAEVARRSGVSAAGC